MRRVLRLSLVCALAGCAAPPEVDVSRFEGRIPPADAGTPALLPLSAVLAAERPRADRGRAVAAARRAEVEARAAALRARAGALAGPVIPADERERLEDALPRPPAS